MSNSSLISSLIARNDKILKFVEAKGLNDDTDVSNKKSALGIDSKKLQEDLNNASNTDRLLRVGIIGRVKAGKSSLLNALVFDGRDILPKAATPMTAALTRMEYSDDVRAEVEFYDEEDLKNIKRKSRQYVNMLREIKANYKAELEKENTILKRRTPDDIEIMADKYAFHEVEKNIELSAAHDQYQRIQKTRISLEELRQHSNIKADTTDDLMGKLNDYVGSSGKFMPYTKSVKLYIPEEGLKDLEIVDTPGVNDPVQSREQRTSEFLSKCDVVLVVSPSGQFLSEEDLRLMGRVTSKDGIRRVYIIASQVDGQLFGSEKEGEFDPSKVLNKIKSKLDAQAKQVLSSRSDLNDSVIDEYKKHDIMGTSSVAYGLYKHFDNRSEWDDNMKHVWNNLAKHYPDYFSDSATAKNMLQKLGEIDDVRKILDDVRREKESIQADRLNNLIQANQRKLKEFIDAIREIVENRIADVETRDLEDERKRSAEMSQMSSDLEGGVAEVYERGIDDFGGMRNELNGILNRETRGFRDDNQVVEKTRYETRSVKNNSWRNVWGLFGSRYRTETEAITEDVINANQVVLAIRRVRNGISSALQDGADNKRIDWQDNLRKEIWRELKEIYHQNQDVDSRLDRKQVNAVIINIFNQIQMPSFELEDDLPSELNKAGVLKDDDAYDFQDAADDYMYNKLVPSIRKDITAFVKKSQDNLKKYDVAKNLVEKLQRDIDRLIKEIENKEMSVDRYKRILEGLKELEKVDA